MSARSRVRIADVSRQISSAGDIARVLVHIMDDFSTKYSHRDIIDVAAEQWIDFEEELIPMIEEMTRCHISHQKVQECAPCVT